MLGHFLCLIIYNFKEMDQIRNYLNELGAMYMCKYMYSHKISEKDFVMNISHLVKEKKACFDIYICSHMLLYSTHYWFIGL